MYSHYRLPTVVMSRLAEQFDKVSVGWPAMVLLLGSSWWAIICMGGCWRPAAHTAMCSTALTLALCCAAGMCANCPLLTAASCARPLAAQAKRVLWGEVQPACDSSVMKMDYKQLCKYIRR